MSFERNIDMGFNRAAIVMPPGITKLPATAAESLARALRANPEIADVALSNAVPFDLFNASNFAVQIQGKSQSVQLTSSSSVRNSLRYMACGFSPVDYSQPRTGKTCFHRIRSIHRHPMWTPATMS